MATRLEGVTIPVDLDTSKAQAKLNELETNLKKDSKKAVDLNRTLSMNSLLGNSGGSGGKGSKTGTTGVSGGPKENGLKERAINAFANKLQASTPVSGALGKVSQAAGVSELGAVAAVYGAIRTVALGAPMAASVGKGLAGLPDNSPLTKSIDIQLENLRNSVAYLESYVKSIVTGVGKTYEMSTAMARVNGRVPNIQLGYGIYREAEMEEDMLRKKFDEFKDKEVAQAVGISITDLFKNGINK